jgi:predicted dehydrogenase
MVRRRRFLQAALASPALSAAQLTPAAASDRLRVGLIGCGGQGRNNLIDFQRNPDVEIAALCDVFQPNLGRARELAPKAEPYTDFRRIIDRKDIDAIVVATPDHWHAYIMIAACDSGKDVYVEKPISHNIREGRLMVEAARRNKRVVQVGIQQRSGTHFQRAVKAVHDGRIGDVHYAQCWNHDHSGSAGMGYPATTDPPPDLDWEMWLGPAPKAPYNSARRGFHWFWETGGGQLTNWCVHLIDVIHWALKADAPLSATASGGKLYMKDCRECPDTLEVAWEYPNCLVRYSTLQHNSYGHSGSPGWKPFGSYGILLHGTKGTLFIDRAGYEITPQTAGASDAGATGSRDAYDDLTGVGMYYTAEMPAERGTTSLQHRPHVRNFLDCVKSRQTPVGDIEIGHHSTVACHLGNIAYRTGQKILWDAKAERITNSPEANKLLARPYRQPWRLAGLEM